MIQLITPLQSTYTNTMCLYVFGHLHDTTRCCQTSRHHDQIYFEQSVHQELISSTLAPCSALQELFLAHFQSVICTYNYSSASRNSRTTSNSMHAGFSLGEGLTSSNDPVLRIRPCRIDTSAPPFPSSLSFPPGNQKSDTKENAARNHHVQLGGSDLIVHVVKPITKPAVQCATFDLGIPIPSSVEYISMAAGMAHLTMPEWIILSKSGIYTTHIGLQR